MADLIEKTSSPHFTGEQALNMLQTRYTVDYSSRGSGSRPASVEDEYYPTFHLDMLTFIGQPLKPLTRQSEQFFDNITVTFRNWSAPYSSKHTHMEFHSSSTIARFVLPRLQAERRGIL